MFKILLASATSLLLAACGASSSGSKGDTPQQDLADPVVAMNFIEGVRGAELEPSLQVKSVEYGESLQLNSLHTATLYEADGNGIQSTTFRYDAESTEELLIVLSHEKELSNAFFEVDGSSIPRGLEAEHLVEVNVTAGETYSINVKGNLNEDVPFTLLVVQANRESANLSENEYLVQYEGRFLVCDEEIGDVMPWYDQYVYNFVDGYFRAPGSNTKVNFESVEGYSHTHHERDYSNVNFEGDDLYEGDWVGTHTFNPRSGSSDLTFRDEYDHSLVTGQFLRRCADESRGVTGQVRL